MLKNRFDQELEFLRDMGAEFAGRYPREAARLGLQSRDPDIERLLEGCAFLCARIRDDMDSEFSELVFPLLNQFWPDAVRPLPSVSVAEFRPRANNITRKVEILKNTPLYLEGERMRCTFRTAYDTTVLPFALESVGLEHLAARPGSERVRLRLVLQPLPGVSLARLELGPLRIHLHGDSRQAFGLYYGLTQDPIVSVNLVRASGERLTSWGTQADAKLCIQPLGFSQQESLLPLAAHSFIGIRHIRDYLCFPGKYLFFDLHGLECISSFPRLTEDLHLEIFIEMHGLADSFMSSPSVDNVRLNCSPVVNLFPHPARPLSVELKTADYRLQPSGTPSHFEIYSVEGLTSTSGIGRTFTKRACVPFPAFGEADPGTVFYQVRHRSPVTASPGGGSTYQPVDVFLSFVDEQGQPAQPPGKVVSIELLATNRDLPLQILSRGDQRSRRLQHSTGVPASVEPWIIGVVSQPSPAPVGNDGLWRFVALALLGWRSCADPDGLRRLLKMIHTGQKHDDVRWRAIELLLHELKLTRVSHEDRLVGTPRTLMRGTHIELALSSEGLAHPGERYLFGAVLNRYLAESSAVNSFARLTLTGAAPEIRLPAYVGTQELL
ncbi:MAG: type VI secretion system baseplate subunit TssF [Polyangia bacterium]